MKKIKTYLIYKISLIIMVCFFVGCNLDVVNMFYNDFESLKEDNFKKFEYKKNGYVYYYAIDDLNGIIYSWGWLKNL